MDDEPHPPERLLRNGEGQNRTADTTIFSRVLYQLSYLARGMTPAAAAHPSEG
jgi:hypothetical protein